jgi:hypothetical protein
MCLRNCCQLLVVAAICAPQLACSSAVRKPTLLHPGPAPYQRDNAQQFDPYPQNDMGPKIMGGRPPDYAIPPNEVTRAFQYSEQRRSTLGLSPTLIPSAPVVAAPAYIPPTPPAIVGPAVPMAPVGSALPAGPPVTYRY